ncbi:MAG: hypothetical protein O2809_10130 [Proteobacteria bacterium]|nr:hypothetical protein [Pseudomonadota bacterium]
MHKQEENPFKPIPNKRYVDDDTENKVVRDHLLCKKMTTNGMFNPFNHHLPEKNNMVLSGQIGVGTSFFTRGKRQSS